MSRKDGIYPIPNSIIDDLIDKDLLLLERVWVREVFCDYSTGYPDKEYITNIFEFSIRPYFGADGECKSDLERYLRGWKKLDPIKYKDDGPKDVPTYYRKMGEKKFYLAFILDYNPGGKRDSIPDFMASINTVNYPLPDLEGMMLKEEFDNQTISTDAIIIDLVKGEEK